MADNVGSCDRHSNNLMENEVNLRRFVCYKCSDYENLLKEIINELSSAETIIKILKKELRSTRIIDNTCTRNQIVVEGPDKKTSYEGMGLNISKKQH